MAGIFNTEEMRKHIDGYLATLASMSRGDGIPPVNMSVTELMAEAKKIYPEGNPDLIVYVATQMQCESEIVGPFVVEAIKKLAGK